MEVKDLALIAETRRACSTGEAKALRAAAGLSLGNIAETCHVDEVTVWRWENGRSAPNGSHALLYGSVLSLLRSLGTARSQAVRTDDRP